MHAWESIQKTLNYIEEHIGEEIQIEELADLAGLSLFYYQRLFGHSRTPMALHRRNTGTSP